MFANSSHCCVRGCRNGNRKNMQLGAKLFRIPRDDRSKAWLKYAMGDDLLNKHVPRLHVAYYVCSDHFTAQDYVDAEQMKLTRFAVPTVHPQTCPEPAIARGPVVPGEVDPSCCSPEDSVSEGNEDTSSSRPDDEADEASAIPCRTGEAIAANGPDCSPGTKGACPVCTLGAGPPSSGCHHPQRAASSSQRRSRKRWRTDPPTGLGVDKCPARPCQSPSRKLQETSTATVTTPEQTRVVTPEDTLVVKVGKQTYSRRRVLDTAISGGRELTDRECAAALASRFGTRTYAVKTRPKLRPVADAQSVIDLGPPTLEPSQLLLRESREVEGDIDWDTATQQLGAAPIPVRFVGIAEESRREEDFASASRVLGRTSVVGDSSDVGRLDEVKVKVELVEPPRGTASQQEEFVTPDHCVESETIPVMVKTELVDVLEGDS